MKLWHRDRPGALFPFYLYSGILCFLLGVSGVLLSSGAAAILFDRTFRQFEAWNDNYRIPWQQELQRWFPTSAIPADTTAVPDTTGVWQLVIGFPEKTEIGGFDSWLQSLQRQLNLKFPGWIAIPFIPADWQEHNLHRLFKEYDRLIFLGVNIRRRTNDRGEPARAYAAIKTELYLYLPGKGMNPYGSKLAASILSQLQNGSIRKEVGDMYALYQFSWEERIGVSPDQSQETNPEYWLLLKSVFDTLLEQLETDRQAGIHFD